MEETERRSSRLVQCHGHEPHIMNLIQVGNMFKCLGHPGRFSCFQCFASSVQVYIVGTSRQMCSNCNQLLQKYQHSKVQVQKSSCKWEEFTTCKVLSLTVLLKADALIFCQKLVLMNTLTAGNFWNCVQLHRST